MYDGTRVIRWFDRQTEWEVDAEALNKQDLSVLRRLFNPCPEDPMMFGCYSIESKHLDVLQPLIHHPIDLDRYDYFLEFDAAKVYSPTRPASAGSLP